MWPQLIEDIQLELKLLHQLLDQSAPLMEAVAANRAGAVERLAAAAMLQSFYNGVENVFDLLAERVDGDRPAGPERHDVLLAAMGAATDARPAVVSGELREGLRQYLEFRNSFRYSHYFRLDWSVAASLVGQCGRTLERLEAELDRFLRGHAKRRLLGRPGPEGLPEYWFAAPQPTAAVRQRLLGPCLLSALVGAALGVGVSVGIGHFRRPAVPPPAAAAEVRRHTAPLAEALRSLQGEPLIRHAVGVLGFFDREDWRFSRRADGMDGSGAMTGRCESLGATAEVTFDGPAPGTIEICTSWDRHVLILAAGRLIRFDRYDAATGRPRSRIEFDTRGQPVVLTEWTVTDGKPERRDRHYAGGKALAEVVSQPPGQVRKLVLRTGAEPAQTVTFVAGAGGRLEQDPNATNALTDLPPR